MQAWAVRSIRSTTFDRICSRDGGVPGLQRRSGSADACSATSAASGGRHRTSPHAEARTRRQATSYLLPRDQFYLLSRRTGWGQADDLSRPQCILTAQRISAWSWTLGRLEDLVEFSHRGGPGELVDRPWTPWRRPAVRGLAVIRVAIEQASRRSWLRRWPGADAARLSYSKSNALQGGALPYRDGQASSSPASCTSRISAVTNQFVNSLQAPVGRRRGAELHLLGSPQPLGAGARAAVQAEQGSVLARRVPRARLRCQPVPRLRAHARRGPQGHRRGLRAARREAEDNVWSLTDAERAPSGYAPLPASLDHALEYMEESSSSRRRRAGLQLRAPRQAAQMAGVPLAGEPSSGCKSDLRDALDGRARRMISQ